MHGQNINLPVCVCVSVTLSFNSLTGQTPQRIFTLDSLKYANRTILLQCDTVNSVNIVPNEKVALDRLRDRQNVLLYTMTA